MKSFEDRYINPGNKRDKNKKSDGEGGMTRRDFIHVAKGVVALSAATVATRELTGSKLWEKISKNGSEENNNDGDPIEEYDESAKKDIFRKRKYHPDMDREAAQKVLGHYNSGKVKLENVKLATENYWYFKYMTNPKLAKSLEDAYINMQPWVTELKRIFEEEKVPVRFIYLAIPESHWSFDQVSPKGAAGPYQIMRGTAQLFGLKANEIVDERLDVEKSARVCARHLREIYDKTGDWDLATSGYNGSFVNQYIGWCRKNKQTCSYEGFIKHLEGRINQLKEDLNKNIWGHKVHNNQSLEDIAKFYDIDWKIIVQKNYLTKDKKNKNYIISSNKKIKIIITDKKTKELIYNRIIGGYIENINYPGKFNAVMSRIEESDFQKTAQSRIKGGANLARK